MNGIDWVALGERVRKEIGQEHRYEHIVGVARTAERLAVAHGEDAERARLAGMLHDLARLYSNERLIRECTARNMPIDAFEAVHPIVLHARLGAELARENYGIEDEAVLSAIRKHTLASANMSRLDTIVYLADALEPGRDFPERPVLETLSLRDLRAGFEATLRSSLAYLSSRGLAVAPATLAALQACSREEKQTA